VYISESSKERHRVKINVPEAVNHNIVLWIGHYIIDLSVLNLCLIIVYYCSNYLNHRDAQYLRIVLIHRGGNTLGR